MDSLSNFFLRSLHFWLSDSRTCGMDFSRQEGMYFFFRHFMITLQRFGDSSSLVLAPTFLNSLEAISQSEKTWLITFLVYFCGELVEQGSSVSVTPWYSSGDGGLLVTSSSVLQLPNCEVAKTLLLMIVSSFCSTHLIISFSSPSSPKLFLLPFISFDFFDILSLERAYAREL
jgi:hypothetical protein